MLMFSGIDADILYFNCGDPAQTGFWLVLLCSQLHVYLQASGCAGRVSRCSLKAALLSHCAAGARCSELGLSVIRKFLVWGAPGSGWCLLGPGLH